MMATSPVWAKYTVFDNMGNVVGIKEDAPEYVKQAYAEYQSKLNELTEKGEYIDR